MLRKYARFQVLEAYTVPQHASRRALRKAAHRVTFDYTPRPGYLYVRSRAISSRCNDNFDEFPAGEIKAAYQTFVGKPVFVNHHNENHKRARGVIIDAALHEDRNADGSPDTWAEVLMEVDAVKFPKLAKAILAGEVDRTSMGCDVQLSVCSACGNKATNPAEYCQHIPALKGQRIFRVNASTGRREGHLVREICSGLSFFENSLLVEEPADPTAVMWGVDDRGMKMTASKVDTAQVSASYAPLSEDGFELDRMQAEAAAGPKYPHPADHPFFQQHPTHPENIISSWHEADDGKKAQGKRWYSDAQTIAGAIAGGDYAKGAGVLAAYSPKAAWPSNMFNAARSLKEGRALGKGEGDSIMGMHQRLAQKMIGDDKHPGEHHSKVLKSPKISDFAHLIEHGGDEDPTVHTRVVIDRHAMSVATGHRMTTKDLEDAPLGSRHYYEHVANHFRQAAATISEHEGQHVAPHQVQAVTWLVQQHKNVAHDLSMPGPGGKGRQTRDKNVWNRWTEERHHHAPDVDSENIHIRNPHAPKVSSKTAKWGDGGPLSWDEIGERHPHLYGDPDYHGEAAEGSDGVNIGEAANFLAHDRADDPDAEGSSVDELKFHPEMVHPAYIDHASAGYRDPRVTEAQKGYETHPTKVPPLVLVHRHGVYQVADGHHRAEGAGRADKKVRAYVAYSPHPDEPFSDETKAPYYAAESHPGRRTAMRKGAPFAGYEDFEDCVDQNSDKDDPDAYCGEIKHRTEDKKESRKHALDEVKAPPEVDTLRDEECPVCGDAEVFDGERCPICGFIAPPSMFRNPDLEMAKQMDLRGDQVQPGSELPGGGGLVDPSQLGPGGTGEAAAEQLQHPDQLGPNGEMAGPGTPGDGIPDLFCPACGEGVDAGQPMSQIADDPNPTPAAGPEEGMPCPNCGMATLLSSGDLEQAGLMAPEELPEGQEGAEGEEGQAGGLVSPEELPEGQEEEEQAVPGEEGQDVPQGEEEIDEDAPPADDEDDKDDSAVDDEDPAAKKRDKNSKGARMSKAVEAAMVAQQSVIDDLTRRNFVLEAQLAFLAKAAGVESQFAAIQRQADINNPASPIPDPPEEGAYETTEQALAPETMDNVQAPGETPGSVQHVPAQQTDVPMQPGMSMPTSPANQLVDVTAPVAGTNTGEVPLNETRIETDVRIGEDPLRASGPGIGGNGNDGTAFPWTMSSKDGEALAANRTMASFRLARLRITAGLAAGDEIAVATGIETDTSLPDIALAHEIRTLEAMGRTAAKQQQRPAGLVPRAAASGRKAPSMASVGVSAGDMGADEDLFLSA